MSITKSIKFNHYLYENVSIYHTLEARVILIYFRIFLNILNNNLIMNTSRNKLKF